MTAAAGRAHALVIGGSLAGLVAARVLSDHFAQVTVVDRDRFPAEPRHRNGVPQSHHIHVMLARGQVTYEHLFPGLAAELAAAGAPVLEWGYDNLAYTLGVWLLRERTGYSTSMCTRELLEHTVRRRVAALGNVRFLEEYETTGLQADAQKTAVTGVRLRLRGKAAGAGPDLLPADLVVDASGRSSRAPQWLEELGYAAPAETTVNSFLGYASRLYELPGDFTADWKAAILRGRPPHNLRGGVIYPIEGGRWLVTLAGTGRDYPPLDEAGFLAFAENLGEPPVLYEAIRNAKPLGPAIGYQRTDNRWRHYEWLNRWPAAFVVLGDAVCAFNPVYGQGMTVAGLDGLALDRCLRQSTGGSWARLGPRFQRAVAQGLSAPWLLATGEDYREPKTEGPRPGPVVRVLHRYIDRVTVAAARDPLVFRTYVEVAHLIKPPAALFSPAVLARVFLGRP